MDIIKSEDIERGLGVEGRVYLCGNLRRKGSIDHIPNEGYEIGISDYPEYTFEKPHYHSFNTEYNYVMSGKLKVLLINEGREIELNAGDLFVINTNEPYVGKAYPGTRTIFSKVPGGDDKVLVEMTDDIRRWGESWDNDFHCK